MKRLFLLILLISRVTIVFGQNDTLIFNFDKQKSYDHSFNLESVNVLTIKHPDFKSVTFNQSIAFGSAKFPKYTDFSLTNFRSRSSFYISEFEETADFSTARFAEEAGFNTVSFKKYANFREAFFCKGADFRLGIFYANADFALSTFYNTSSFSEATLKDNINFYGTTFMNTVNFESIRTTNSTTFDFSRAILPNIINFSNNIELQHVVDFTAADSRHVKLFFGWVPSIHYINLNKSDIPQIRIDYHNFRLCFFKTASGDPNLVKNFSKFLPRGRIKDTLAACISLLKVKEVRQYLQRIFPSVEIVDPSGSLWYRFCRIFPWYNKNHPAVISPPPAIKDFLVQYLEGDFPDTLTNDEITAIYEKVLKTFETTGQQVSHQELDIEYKDFKNGKYNLSRLWYNYGYNKEWIFYWTLFFLLLFTLITSFFIGELNKTAKSNGVYYLKNIPHNLASIKWRKRIWFSLMYTSTIFFLVALKVENLNFQRRIGICYILLIYSVGLLCLGYMANFVLQK